MVSWFVDRGDTGGAREDSKCNLELTDDTYSSDVGHVSDLSEEAGTSSDGLGQDGLSAGNLLKELLKGVGSLDGILYE